MGGNLFNNGKMLATQADVDKLTKEEAAKLGVIRTKDRKPTDKKSTVEAGVPKGAPVKSITKEEAAKTASKEDKKAAKLAAKEAKKK